MSTFDRPLPDSSHGSTGDVHRPHSLWTSAARTATFLGAMGTAYVGAKALEAVSPGAYQRYEEGQQSERQHKLHERDRRATVRQEFFHLLEQYGDSCLTPQLRLSFFQEIEVARDDAAITHAIRSGYRGFFAHLATEIMSSSNLTAEQLMPLLVFH